MKDNLRILYLSPFPPRLDTDHGGGRVIAQFLASLAKRHSTAVIYMRSPDEPSADPFFQVCCDLLEEVPRPWAGPSPRQKVWRAARLLSGLAAGRPLWISDWYTPEVIHRVQRLIRDWQPDIVQFDTHSTGQYHTALNGAAVPRLMVVQEPGVLSSPYLKQVPRFAGRLLHALDRSAWQQYEPALVAKMDAVVVYTHRDEEIIRGQGNNTPVVRIPFGVPLPDQPLDPLGGEPPNLLFTGNFIHPPNREAALILAREIFPRVREKLPQARLVIAGPQPPDELKALSGPGMQITGRVPDVTPYLDQAALVAAPIFSGGGMRVKVLEALAAGKALVATPLAVEGLDLTDGDQAAIAGSVEEFSQKIIELLVDRESRARMASHARAWACLHLSWDFAVDEFERLYDRLREGDR